MYATRIAADRIEAGKFRWHTRPDLVDVYSAFDGVQPEGIRKAILAKVQEAFEGALHQQDPHSAVQILRGLCS